MTDTTTTTTEEATTTTTTEEATTTTTTEEATQSHSGFNKVRKPLLPYPSPGFIAQLLQAVDEIAAATTTTTEEL
jgi:hypothetical protein